MIRDVWANQAMIAQWREEATESRSEVWQLIEIGRIQRSETARAILAQVKKSGLSFSAAVEEALRARAKIVDNSEIGGTTQSAI